LQNRNEDGNENAMKQTDETDNEKDNEEAVLQKVFLNKNQKLFDSAQSDISYN